MIQSRKFTVPCYQVVTLGRDEMPLGQNAPLRYTQYRQRSIVDGLTRLFQKLLPDIRAISDYYLLMLGTIGVKELPLNLIGCGATAN